MSSKWWGQVFFQSRQSDSRSLLLVTNEDYYTFMHLFHKYFLITTPGVALGAGDRAESSQHLCHHEFLFLVGKQATSNYTSIYMR